MRESFIRLSTAGGVWQEIGMVTSLPVLSLVLTPEVSRGGILFSLQRVNSWTSDDSPWILSRGRHIQRQYEDGTYQTEPRGPHSELEAVML